VAPLVKDIGQQDKSSHDLQLGCRYTRITNAWDELMHLLILLGLTVLGQHGFRWCF